MGLQFSLILKGLRLNCILDLISLLRSAVFPDTEGIETFGWARFACVFESAVFPDTEGIETRNHRGHAI